jgi:hypothetical protein
MLSTIHAAILAHDLAGHLGALAAGLLVGLLRRSLYCVPTEKLPVASPWYTPKLAPAVRPALTLKEHAGQLRYVREVLRVAHVHARGQAQRATFSLTGDPPESVLSTR